MLSEEEKKAIKVLAINPKIIADLDKELLYKMFEFEGQSIEELKEWAYKVVLNLINKQQKQLNTIKEYAHQEIVHYTEDIRDYIDDDKEGNKHIICELKEYREHWKDIEKILQNKPKEELYLNWWKDGLYE